MYKLLIFLCSLGLIGLQSCKVKKEIKGTKTSDNETVKKKKVMDLCETNGSEVNWGSYNEEIDLATGDVPTNFAAFVTDPEVLKDYLSNKKNDGVEFKFAIPVFQDKMTECMVFSCVASNTLSPELQKKYGSVKTFKGTSINDPSSTIRFEYSQSAGLTGYMNIGDKAIQFMPYMIGNETIYLCYDKSESGRIKQQFEK